LVDHSLQDVIGREPELAALGELLSNTRERFAILLLEGEPGIGKTTIFQLGLQLADKQGFHVLSCRPSASEVSLSLSACADLLGTVPAARLGALPAPQRRALAGALLQVDHPVDLRAVAAGLRSLVTALAEERPVLLAIDDLQWLDPTSAEALEFVLRRLGRERVGLLATQRVSQPLRLELNAMIPRDSLVRRRLGPMSLATLQRVIKQQLGHALPRSLLARVHQTSAAIPCLRSRSCASSWSGLMPSATKRCPCPTTSARSFASA
jgi:predicted ATPase